MMRIWHTVDFWREFGHNSGEDGVGDNETAGAEHEWFLAADGVKDESDETGHWVRQSSGNRRQVTHKKFVIGPTAP